MSFYLKYPTPKLKRKSREPADILNEALRSVLAANKTELDISSKAEEVGQTAFEKALC